MSNLAELNWETLKSTSKYSKFLAVKNVSQSSPPKANDHYTVPKEIDFPQHNIKCSGENVTLHGIFHLRSCFPLLSCYIAEIWITFRTVINWPSLLIRFIKQINPLNPFPAVKVPTRTFHPLVFHRKKLQTDETFFSLCHYIYCYNIK